MTLSKGRFSVLNGTRFVFLYFFLHYRPYCIDINLAVVLLLLAVCECTILKINTYFSPGRYDLCLAAGKKKWLCIYVHYFTNCVIISLYWCRWTQTYLTYWRVAGADVNRSTSFPCFSRLAISLSSVNRAVNRHLHFFPMVIV